MKSITALLHVSLDGFVAGPKGEMDWIQLDAEMFDFVNVITAAADTALYGRITWQMMDNYWPTAADKPGATKHDKEHAAWYNSVDKIVVSNSMKGLDAGKTVFIGDDIAGKIKALKQKEGKDILLIGSPSVVRTLMKDNLIDEYWLFLNPFILGHGISMFTPLDNRVELTLKQIKNFPCGIAGLNYRIK